MRLARFGRRHMPFYRIRVCNKNVKRDGKYIEEVSNLRGCLMPPSWERTIPFLWTTEWRNCGWMWVGNHLRGEWCTDRVKYWLSVGAQPSQTVAVLLGRVCCGFTAVICRQAFFLFLPFVPLFRVLSLRRLRRKKERLLRRKSRFLLCTVCERKGVIEWGVACYKFVGCAFVFGSVENDVVVICMDWRESLLYWHKIMMTVMRWSKK